MGISEEAITKRQNVPEQFRAVPNTSGSGDIELIFVNPAQRAAADVERRNQEVTANGDELDRERLAQNAGISNRDHLTGASQQEKTRVAEQERTKANADARMTTLLALQGQADFWRGEEERYGGYVDALDNYRNRLDRGETFTEEELPKEVREAIEEYKEAFPHDNVDWNDHDAISRIHQWAAQNRDSAAGSAAKFEELMEGAPDNSLQKQNVSVAKEHAEDPFAGLACSNNFNNCALGKSETDLAFLKEDVVKTPSVGLDFLK